MKKSRQNARIREKNPRLSKLKCFFIIFSHLSKFHLVHTLASVPMQEGFTFKHGGELLTDSFEQFLNACAVSNERR